MKRSQSARTKSKRNLVSGDSIFIKRLASYATAAGATAAVVAAPPSAQARIVYTPLDVKISGTRQGTSDSYTLSPDGVHEVLTLYAGGVSSSFFTVFFDATGISGAEVIVSQGGLGGGINVLNAGQKIGASANFKSGGYFAFVFWTSGDFNAPQPGGQWIGISNKYFGFNFSIDGKTHYGWGRISVSSPGAKTIDATLTGVAYETIPNRRILAGQENGSYAEPGDKAEPEARIEPTDLGALALGAAGIPIWRKDDQETYSGRTCRQRA